MLRCPTRLQLNDATLGGVLAYLQRLRSLVTVGDAPIVLDLSRCSSVDTMVCVMLHAEMERSELIRPGAVHAVYPRAILPRLQMEILGVAGAEPPQLPAALPAGAAVSRIVSGTRGDPNPGQTIFDVARVAGHIGPEQFSDRVHGALNEAAENVLAWAYEEHPLAAAPRPTDRWWLAGLQQPGHGVFLIALDHGLGIPATAPRHLAPELRAQHVALASRPIRPNDPMSDTEVLMATIRHKRSASERGERGKGLANMIGLIDEAGLGSFNLFSGRAHYGYVRDTPFGLASERCSPLGIAFPGTLIVWHVRPLPAPPRPAPWLNSP